MTHVSSLRLSLLVSLGIVPLACGGSVRHDADADAGQSGGGSSGDGAVSGQGGAAAGGAMTRGGAGTGGAVTGGGTAPIGGVTSAGGAPIGLPACTSPQRDEATGLVRCSEGYFHRPTAVICDASAGAPGDYAQGAGGDSGESVPLPRADGSVTCEDDDAQCRGFALGYCDTVDPLEDAVCLSGCRTDSDCGPGAVCLCGGRSPSGGVCRPSECHTDRDCGPGSRCANYGAVCSSGGFACQRVDDACSSPADCADGTCSWRPATGRYCESAICGRPFLIDAEARVAPVVSREDWSASALSRPRVEHLTRAERAALAQHWTRLGQLEHASIAAFARFSLQLLSLGAPPELVQACTRALADETAHTQCCFHFASCYAGRAIGPGPLDIAGSLLPSSLEAVVELVIAEGCFGETRAALEALEAAEGASDPVIARAYRQIAWDEQRHAELAFQFVRWALQRSPEAVARCISSAVASAPEHDASALGVTVPCLQGLLAA